jgi:hypothetical protein
MVEVVYSMCEGWLFKLVVVHSIGKTSSMIVCTVAALGYMWNMAVG